MGYFGKEKSVVVGVERVNGLFVPSATFVMQTFFMRTKCWQPLFIEILMYPDI